MSIDKHVQHDTVEKVRSSQPSLSPDSGKDEGPYEDTVVSKIPKKTWRSYFWDTLDKSPEERRFLFKLDAALLSMASLAFFLKYLDQVNINNAFVSGMREDLGLYGNELNYMQTLWTVGYIIGEIPRCDWLAIPQTIRR
jgi:MFS transporter, ACS family, pantothenate transporter